MKGIVPIMAFAVVAILGILLVFGQQLIGIASVFQASVADASCIPGTILMPEYKTIRCEATSGLQGTYVAQTYTGADCPIGLTCAKAVCPPDARGVEGERCLVRLENMLYYDILPQAVGRAAKAAPDEFYIDFGITRTVIVYPGLFQVPSVQVKFKTKALNLYTASGIFGRKLCDTCDITCLVGTDAALKDGILDRDYKAFMQVGDTAVTVERWQAYPQAGNVIKYSGQDAQCVVTGSNTAEIYALGKVDTRGGCYYARGNVIASGQCCPGDTLLGMTCGSDFKWKETHGVCCPAGVCSVEYCPGRGGWDWDSWRAGQPLYKYRCMSITGNCEVADVKYGVQCNPMTGFGCPGNQRCDPATWTCTTAPIIRIKCVEFGQECCIAGQVPDNVEARSCAEAGKPGFLCIDGFCVQPLPVTKCDYDGTCEDWEDQYNCTDCQACNWLCQIFRFLWVWIVAFAITCIAIFVTAMFVPFLKKLVLSSPIMFLLVAGMASFLLVFVFTVPIAAIATMARAALL